MHRTKHHEKPDHKALREIGLYCVRLLQEIEDGNLSSLGLDDKENLPLQIIKKNILDMNYNFSVYKKVNLVRPGFGYRGFTEDLSFRLFIKLLHCGYNLNIFYGGGVAIVHLINKELFSNVIRPYLAGSLHSPEMPMAGGGSASAASVVAPEDEVARGGRGHYG